MESGDWHRVSDRAHVGNATIVALAFAAASATWTASGGAP
jgi:hypothetical protein